MSNLYYDAGAPCESRKVLLATTAYDCPDASYTYSIARSRELLHKEGIGTAYLLLQGNCHVDDSRNTVVRDFLESDCTDLVFLDADVSWEPEDLLTLCQHDCDVVGGVYPYRREGGKEGMPVRNKRECFEPDENGLLEVEGLPTGFLRIRRHVLASLAEDAPSFRRGNKGRIPVIFERDILGEGRRGGDIAFCMKWQAMGGRLYASADLRLGHCGKHVIRDSLSASLRRQMGATLAYIAQRIKNGEETRRDIAEAVKYVANPWGAEADWLSLALVLARKARGPILEAGSGLSTVLMAAATDEKVWCLEHSPVHALRLEQLALEAGVNNIAIVQCRLRDGWYDLSEDIDAMPKRYAVGVIDGPPRALGDRMKFFDVFGDKCKVFLADDADDSGYADQLTSWADQASRPIELDDGRAAVILEAA